jgi:hypothetical protein
MMTWLHLENMVLKLHTVKNRPESYGCTGFTKVIAEAAKAIDAKVIIFSTF